MQESHIKSANTLFEALKERDIALTIDDVLGAFECVATQENAEAWVNEYLGRATILSKEELELFRKLSRKSTSQAAAPRSVPIVHDSEIESALKVLQSSVANINRHCVALEAQKDSLLALVNAGVPAPAIEHSQGERARRQTDETGRLSIACEEVFGSTADKLEHALLALESSSSSINSLAQEQLNSDERSLARVSKVIQAIESRVDGIEDEAQIDRLLRALTALTESRWTDRMDELCAFPHVNTTDVTAQNAQLNTLGEREDLTTELASLRTDIRSVADMVVNTEFGQPLSRSNKMSGQSQASSQQAWAKYVFSSLKFIQERSSLSRESILNLAAYGDAISQVLPVHRAHVQRRDQTRVSVDRRRSSMGMLKHLQQSSLQVPEAIAPVLRQFEIDLKSARGDTLVEKLDAIVSDRSTQLVAQSGSMETNAVHGLGQLQQTRLKELQDLTSSIHAQTKYSTIVLGNASQDARLGSLEESVNGIEQAMSDFESGDLDPIIAENLIRKWYK